MDVGWLCLLSCFCFLVRSAFESHPGLRSISSFSKSLSYNIPNLDMDLGFAFCNFGLWITYAGAELVFVYVGSLFYSTIRSFIQSFRNTKTSLSLFPVIKGSCRLANIKTFTRTGKTPERDRLSLGENERMR